MRYINGKEQLVPDVHSQQFSGPGADPAYLGMATRFVKHKCWREEPAASNAWDADAHRRYTARCNCCDDIRQYNSKLWKPTSGETNDKSSVAEFVFHGLNSLLWEWVSSGAEHDDDVNFEDLSMFFCLCPIWPSSAPPRRHAWLLQRGRRQGRAAPRGSCRGRSRGLRLGSQRRSSSRTSNSIQLSRRC